MVPKSKMKENSGACCLLLGVGKGGEEAERGGKRGREGGKKEGGRRDDLVLSGLIIHI